MIEYLLNYSYFALKTLTIVLLIFLPIILIIRGKSSDRNDTTKIAIEHINANFEDSKLAFETVLSDKKKLTKYRKDLKNSRKKNSKSPHKKRSFICQFEGDIKASQVEQLRREITAMLLVASSDDEVIVVLNSGGGTIHGYGLAASQLSRIRDKGITLTVCVDSIAASGGYMMACVADKLSAAPFAIVGSIGVIAQIPNFNKVLKEKNIEYEQITAGEHKRTLTMFGENTLEGRTKFQSELDEAHELFKEFVMRFRPNLDVDKIATGEHWFGAKALELGLVDEIATSDEVIMQRVLSRDVYRIKAERKKSAIERLIKPSVKSILDLFR
jgi:serine protease SohB